MWKGNGYGKRDNHNGIQADYTELLLDINFVL